MYPSHSHCRSCQTGRSQLGGCGGLVVQSLDERMIKSRGHSLNPFEAGFKPEIESLVSKEHVSCKFFKRLGEFLVYFHSRLDALMAKTLL